MTKAVYWGKRIKTTYGSINSNGVKIPVYERDVLLDKLAKQEGLTFLEILNEEYNEMTCAELKAIVA